MITEAALRAKALDYSCPDCGAKAGGHCRRKKGDVRRNPCDARVALAWQDLRRAEPDARAEKRLSLEFPNR